MYSKIITVVLSALFISIGYSQTKNKYSPYGQPKKWRKEEARLKKLEEEKKANSKIWELPFGETVVYKENGYEAMLKSHATKTKPQDFFGLVSDRSISPPLFVEFRGKCEQQMTVKAQLLTYNNPLLATFLKTKDFKDLKIEPILSPLLKGLKDQCDDLESLRFTTSPIALAYDKNGKSEVITIRGSMDKSNNWKLKEGFSDALDSFVIKFKTAPFYKSMLAINYEGACNKTQKLHIKPVFSNNTERYAYRNETSLFNFKEVAKRSIKMFLVECQDVDTFEFSIDYIPESVFVREGKKGIIRATKTNNWELDLSEFGYYSAEAPRINDYEDILTQLETNEFPFFERYEDFFKLFYEDFMDIYGTVCRNNLINPTKISIHAFESRYNSEGFKISENSLGPPQVLYVETKYLKRYQRFSQQNKITVLYNVFKAFSSRNQQSGVDAILFRIRGSQLIKKYINDNCDSKELEAVYNYIQELALKLN